MQIPHHQTRQVVALAIDLINTDSISERNYVEKLLLHHLARLRNEIDPERNK